MRAALNNDGVQLESSRQSAAGGRKYDIIAVGTSAGGFHALMAVLGPLPGDFNCGVIIVQHLSPVHKSHLAELLVPRTAMHVCQARDGQRILPATVYIAPPDLHLVMIGQHTRLTHGAAVRYNRPCIDLLFNSVAAVYGERAIGVVLTGCGCDGAAGLRAIKQAGGTTIAEDPEEAEYGSMPSAAIATGCVDMVLPLSKIAGTLVMLSQMRAPGGPSCS